MDAVGHERAVAEQTWKTAPEHRHILSTQEDSVVRVGAMVQRNDHDVPQRNCYTIDRVDKNNAVFAKPPALHSLNLNSRLDYHAHGNAQYAGPYSPSGLAEKLHGAGLREVGVLKIQACDVGKKDYLEQLGRELDGRGVKVGYLAAPKGTLADVRCAPSCFGKAFVISPIPFLGKCIGAAPETLRLKVVQGNAPPEFYAKDAFKGTRYSAPEPPGGQK